MKDKESKIQEIEVSLTVGGTREGRKVVCRREGGEGLVRNRNLMILLPDNTPRVN
jgi:hypothetical protein